MAEQAQLNLDDMAFLPRFDATVTHNEVLKFPLELKPEWHHCLLGCLYCQTYCPVNRKVAGWIKESGTLDARDTAILLEGGSPEPGRICFHRRTIRTGTHLKALLFTPGNVKTASKLLTKAYAGGLNYVR